MRMAAPFRRRCVLRPERFAFQWSPDDPSYRTTVEIDLEEDSRGTIIRY